jgi:hypothetical protein
LFHFDRPCVWNNLTHKHDCLQKLKRECRCEFNDKYNSYPAFWDEHYHTIIKFFYPNKLTVELANLFNAPIESIDPAIEITEDVRIMIELRRNYNHDQRLKSDLTIFDERNPEFDFDTLQSNKTFNGSAGNENNLEDKDLDKGNGEGMTGPAEDKKI